MATGPKSDGLETVVFVGSFNPAIFHPAWFELYGLISPEDAAAAEVEVVHNELVALDLDWVKVRSDLNRCVFEATDTLEAPEALRDLALGTFRVLESTPITKLGINDTCDFEIGSHDRWDGIGRQLAPDENWTDVLRNPGMRSLTMEGRRPDDRNGYIRVTVEPSVFNADSIYVQINDHYEIESPADHVTGSEEILEILESEWDASLARNIEILNHVYETRLVDNGN